MLTTACGGARTVQLQCVVPTTVPLGDRHLNTVARNHLSRVSGNHEPMYGMCPNRRVRPKAGAMDCNYQRAMRYTEDESKFGGKAKEGWQGSPKQTLRCESVCR